MTEGLTAFQRTVAELFFQLPSSDGFLLAGGGGLLASGLTQRPTDDLDFFGQRGRANVVAVAAELIAAITQRGWSFITVHDFETFVRLRVIGDEELAVDIAIDVPPTQPPAVSIAGPTFGPEELAGRKLIALFDRAMPRDFADVYVLAQRFGRATLMTRAGEIDAGFNHAVLADMMRSVARIADHEIEVDPAIIGDLRDYFDEWADELDRA